jgi:hypothetical protein
MFTEAMPEITWKGGTVKGGLVPSPWRRNATSLNPAAGLGGAGKASVAIEYAYRHLNEVEVCWQFAAGDPAVLASE